MVTKVLGLNFLPVTSSFDKPSERGPIELVECRLKLKNFFFFPRLLQTFGKWKCVRSNPLISFVSLVLCSIGERMRLLARKPPKRAAKT